MTRTKATIQSILKSEEKWWEKKQNREGRAETSAGDQHFTFGWLRTAVASWVFHQAGGSRPQKEGQPRSPGARARGAVRSGMRSRGGTRWWPGTGGGTKLLGHTAWAGTEREGKRRRRPNRGQMCGTRILIESSSHSV